MGTRLAKEIWQHSASMAVALTKCTTVPIPCLQWRHATGGLSPQPISNCQHNPSTSVNQWKHATTTLPRICANDEAQPHYATELVAAWLAIGMQYAKSKQLLYKPTFVVVVLDSEDPSPGSTCVVDDRFDIQRFECEGVNHSDRDPLWKMKNTMHKDTSYG